MNLLITLEGSEVIGQNAIDLLHVLRKPGVSVSIDGLNHTIRDPKLDRREGDGSYFISATLIEEP